MASDKISGMVAYLRSKVPFAPELAIACGSGLARLADSIEQPIRVQYNDIPGFPVSTVAGHSSELVFGTLNGKKVVAQRGRFHFYEGYSMQTVAVAIRVFAGLGVKVVLLTNAAGGLNPSFNVADIMIINDHISLPCLSGNHPLVGQNDSRFGPRFPPVNGVWRPELQAVVRQSAESLGLSSVLRTGTYFHDSGPTYESPSEVRMMRVMGGDAVGMSTVPEVLVAAHCGLAVLGLSLITNQCRAPGDSGVPPSHEEVLEASEKRAADMQRLVADVVGRLDTASLPVPSAAAAFAGAAAPTSGHACSHCGCSSSSSASAADAKPDRRSHGMDWEDIAKVLTLYGGFLGLYAGCFYALLRASKAM